jgi:hypothetical protein
MTMKEGGVPITPEVLALGWSDYVLIALVSPAHMQAYGFTVMLCAHHMALPHLGNSKRASIWWPLSVIGTTILAHACKKDERVSTNHIRRGVACGCLDRASCAAQTARHTTTSSPQLKKKKKHTPPASHDRMHHHKLSFLSSWPGCRCDHGCSQQGFCRAAQDTDHATARDRRFEEGRMTRLSCLRGKDMTSVTLSPSERRYAASSQQGSTTVPFVAPARQNKKLILWFDCRLVWSY